LLAPGWSLPAFGCACSWSTCLGINVSGVCASSWRRTCNGIPAGYLAGAWAVCVPAPGKPANGRVVLGTSACRTAELAELWTHLSLRHVLILGNVFAKAPCTPHTRKTITGMRDARSASGFTLAARVRRGTCLAGKRILDGFFPDRFAARQD